MRTQCLRILTVAVFAALAGSTSNSVYGQVPSDVDTMRIIDATADVGDTVPVDLYFRNVDTLGAYSFRVVFNQSLIEPLTDTSEGNVSVEFQNLRTDAFEAEGGTIPEPGVFTFFTADFDLDTNSLFLPDGSPALRTWWRVKTSATPGPTPILFVNDPLFPQSFNTFSDIRAVILKRPRLINGTFTITAPPCDCPHQADIEPDGFLTAIDLAACVDILFAGNPDVQDPTCPTKRFDFDCDGFTTAVDLALLADFLFAGGAPPCDPCLD